MSKITPTAKKVLDERYFIDGETEWGQLTARVSSHFGTTAQEVMDFNTLMLDLDFLPNSPTLMNAGTDINSFSACFVLPIEDDIESIYKFYSDAALISKSGGGIGANYSAIRMAGAPVGSTNGAASGPLSFMRIQDTSTEEIKQGGRRRGANMGILSCDHPDILDFVKAKDTKGELENFNLSVGITDEFMDNVTELWDADDFEQAGFSEEKVNADCKLWDELVQRAWSSAEPGVLFMDTIEEGNTIPHLGKLNATNPCGEQPLLPYESCTLGSINLSNHVVVYEGTVGGTSIGIRDPKVDWDKLKQTVHNSVLFLNRILDKSEMPIPECQEAMERTRKIGLGIMGLHDMLIQLGVPYDSEEGRKIAGDVMRFIAKEANEASVLIGSVEGRYGGWYSGAPIRRNACLTTIAPTGTLSMIADCSSGCEPYYAPVTVKTVLDGQSFIMPNKWVERFIMKHWTLGDHELPLNHLKETGELPQALKDTGLFKGAGDIHWRDHILMQAELQKHVDSSISKTINMPNDATVEDVRDAYELAWRSDCKGVTVYRDGSRETQVLSTESRVGQSTLPYEGKVMGNPPPSKATLPDELDAKRYRIVVDGCKMYILVCEDSSGRPMEVFVKFPYDSIDSTWNTVCRQLSLSMRYGVPLPEIIKQLEKSVVVINDVASNLARILKMYLDAKGMLEIACPDCYGEVIFEEGCEHCVECGWSKCG